MSPIDKTFFLKFFVSGGFVFDFTDKTFSTFTISSVGVDVKAKYGGSKGKALTAFADNASEEDVVKLFSDLIDYYELNYECDNNKDSVFSKCKKLIKKYKNFSSLATPTLKNVDREYIKSISARANKDIEEGNFDEAFTKARTLIEEVFCKVIEDAGQTPLTSGEISRLYKQVKDCYKMHPAEYDDKRIKELLSGLEKIITSISLMRDKNGDSHGLGCKRLNVKSYHARLFVNSAFVLADFILSVAENKQ